MGKARPEKAGKSVVKGKLASKTRETINSPKTPDSKQAQTRSGKNLKMSKVGGDTAARKVILKQAKAQNNNAVPHQQQINQILMGNAGASLDRSSKTTSTDKSDEIDTVAPYESNFTTEDSATGDGILITVHANEQDEFVDNDEMFDNSDIDNSEVGVTTEESEPEGEGEEGIADTSVMTDGEIQFNRHPRSESAAEIAEKYKDKPNFLNLVQAWLKIA